MEVKLDPSLIDAINKAKAKPDWRAIAQRIAALEGGWCLVWTSEKPATEWVREHLRRVGCRAEVRSLQGYAVNERPWTGWKTFARIPDVESNLAVFSPSGKLLRAPSL